MLQRLRDKAEGWIAWVIIGLVAATFVFFGAGSLFDGIGRPKNVVAKVNGTKITAQELDTLYQQWLKQPNNESYRQVDPKVVKNDLLQYMIDQAILLQNTKKLGMSIPADRITQILATIPFLQDATGQFSPSIYAQFLANSNHTDESFRQLIRDSLLRQQVEQGIMQTAFSLPVDIQDLVKFKNQQRDFRYTVVSKEPFEKDVAVTDEEVKQYYDTHLKDFLTDEQVSINYIHLSLEDLLKKYEPKDSDLKNYYQENIHMFTEPKSVHVAHILVSLPKNAAPEAVQKAKARAEEIEKKLNEGTSFSELAKQYSDDEGTASNDGELQWFSPGEMGPDFEKAAFALNEVGQVTHPPVRTDFGFHIIKLLDKKDEKPKPYEQVKDEVREKARQYWAQEQLIKQAEDLNEQAYDTPDSLQAASDKLGLPIQNTDLFTREGEQQNPILKNSEVIATAFSINVKDEKHNSDLIKIDPENYIVLRVSKHVPTEQKSLDLVKDQINTLLTNKKIEQLVKNAAEKIVTELKANTDNAAVLSQYSWVEQQNEKRTDRNVDSEILTAAFSMQPNSAKPEVKAVSLNDGNYAVVWLKQVQNGNLADLSQDEKEDYERAMSKHWGELEFALYASDLFKKAKIEKELK